jgi:hypothetical protein
MNNIDDVRSIAQIKHIENREKKKRLLEKRARREITKIYRHINRNAQKGMFEYAYDFSHYRADYLELSELVANILKNRGYEVEVTHERWRPGSWMAMESSYCVTELLIRW